MERINFERLEFFEKRINEIFNQVTEENNLSLEDLDKLFSTNLEIKNKYLTEMQVNAEDLTFWFNEETQKEKITVYQRLLLVYWVLEQQFLCLVLL